MINSANSNSSLIQTIESSESMVNPSVYNVKEVNPTYSSQWIKNTPINGTPSAGGTSNFNLQKYGIIQQILFTYQKKVTVTSDGSAGHGAGYKIEAHDIFNTIEKVELLSSSRVVSILTAEDLAAQFSNLKADEFSVIKRTCLFEVDKSTIIVPGASLSVENNHTYVVPLHFGFMDDVNLNLNSSFLETLSIRIKYSPHITNHSIHNVNGTGAVVPSTTLIEPNLRVLYKSLPEQATAQMLAENFSSDSLVQVSSRFYDENSVFDTQTADKPNHTVHVELKNTDCVESFYVMVRKSNRTKGGTNQNGGFGTPEVIKKLEYTASGQQVCELNELELPYTKIKENGWATSQGEATATSDVTSLFHVMKIQNGLYHDYNRLSNTQSLRELNAPRISVTYDAAANTEYEIKVMEHTTAVYQISSQTGRLQLALSN
jgi:hypothetical protein